MGELHLDIIVDRMRREFNVEASVGAPQVAYRECIKKAVEQEGKFVKQSGGRGQFGHVWLKIEPNEAGKGFEGQRVVISGSGNVATYANQKATQMGGKVIAMSDSNGYIVDENGIDYKVIKEIKEVKRARIKTYLDYVPTCRCMTCPTPR